MTGPPALARTPAVTALQGQGPADALLEASWPGRGRPIRGAELRLELGLTAAFLAVAGALALTASSSRPLSPVAVLVVAAYAVAARVEFPIGAGFFVPTQLFLVPLFVVAPAQDVPLLVFAGAALAVLVAAASGKARLDRLVFSAGDSVHALGPALVLVAFAGGDAAQAGAGLVLAAFAAQLLADVASSSFHELLAMGSPPDVHLRNLLETWGVDLALGVVGLLAAAQALDTAWAALAPLPLVLLLRQLAADRTRRINDARDRLVALEVERGRHEAAHRIVEQQTAFLQDTSHELRTPVTIARGHIENLVRVQGHSPEADVAIDELARIERIVERLLVLARADQPTTLHPVDLKADEFLEDCFVRWSDAVPRPWQLGELAPGTVRVDADALRAALDALLENAVNHTTVEQEIRLSSRVDEHLLAIEVADRGQGIPPSALGQIFDRFARAKSSARGVTGLGLGLAMVDAVARAHGGSCRVSSSVGGSTFVLCLPLAGAEAPRRTRRPRTGAH